jgi:purine-nucleoside phosphorylase
MSEYMNKINESTEFIKSKLEGFEPEVGLILGSGLGIMAGEVENPKYIEYSSIPNFLRSTVHGHKGRFVAGTLMGRKVIVMDGRFHYYEGYNIKDITFPVRVMKCLGVKNILLTNAAGGVNTSFSPGNLMLITDHINMSANNPLIGENYEEFGPRFADSTNIYDRDLNEKIVKISKENGIHLQKGVYMFNTGPSYETPAEIKMARVMGADAVGMSTVPEAIVASHSGIKVTGISCITNMAAGILNQKINHEEVIETANEVKSIFIKLVKLILPELK